MSFCLKIAAEIKQNVFGGKSEAGMYTAIGTVTWYRYTDGQIYEIEIRPAKDGRYLNDFARMKNLPEGLSKQQIGKYIDNEMNTDTTETIRETNESPLKKNLS